MTINISGVGKPTRPASARMGEMAVKAGIIATLTSLPVAAQAQTIVQKTAKKQDNGAPVLTVHSDTVLETVTISGNRGQTNTNAAYTGFSRLPERVQDIPQVINTIPERVIAEQNITTLEQALRNVPGITAAIGEGYGGMNGDRFRVRGFEALGDNYSDGLRDFGVYVRDSFNMEQIQVFKGPNGENFGVGTTGGAINSTSKKARTGTFGSTDVSGGSGSMIRSTLDYNKQINDTTAARFNFMGNWQDIPDRNHVESDRWGAAGSLGFGLGTEQTWHLDYMFQHNDRTPDYGVPFVKTPKGTFHPVTEYGVPRQIFYGKDSDSDKSDIHMLTSTYSNEANDWLTIKNDTRYTHFTRWFSTTPPICKTANGETAGCSEALFGKGGDPVLALGAGGGVSYDQTSWGIQNVTTGIAKFETGPFRHKAVFGIDMMYQNDKRQEMDYSTPKKKHASTLWHENTDSSYYHFVKDPDGMKNSDSHSFALFASDRLWLSEQFSVVGGVRWDHQKINYDRSFSAGVNSYSADANYASPKASVIWEPTKDQTYYVSYSVSNNLPFGQYITSDVNAITPGREDVKPEKSKLYEVGAKVDLLDGRLGLNGAVFQVQKDNSLYSNPDGSLTRTGEKQCVRGFETGLTGKLTTQWVVYASYAYLDSEVLDAANKQIIGNSVGGAIKNSASLWTTYDMAPYFNLLDGKLLVGGGMTYRDAVSIRSDKLARIPHSFSLDAMVSYEAAKWNLSLNAYNLTDRLNYDTFFEGAQAASARAIPSSDRTFVVRLGAKF